MSPSSFALQNPLSEKKRLLVEEMFAQYMTKNDTILQNQAASLQAFETKVGQLTNAINSLPQGKLPSSIKTNPNEQCNAIILKTRKQVKQSIHPISNIPPPSSPLPSMKLSGQ